MGRRFGVLPVLVALVAVGGCGADEEPSALDELRETSPPAATSSTPSPEPSVTPTPDAEEFTQPFLPEGEPSTVEVQERVEVEGVDDLDEEESAVVTDLAEFVADWDAVLFGLPFEESGLAETAAGDQLSTLQAYAEESIELERVIVGSPTLLRVLDVSVDGEQATVQACLISAGWTELRGGDVHDMVPAVERSTLGLVQESGRWLAESSVSGDASECNA